MNCLYFVVYLLCIIKTIYAAIEGHLVSLRLDSNRNPFSLRDVKYLIVFGDSYSEKVMDNNWTATFLENKNITDYNYAVGGAVVDNNIVPRDNYDSSFLTQFYYFCNRGPIEKMNEYNTLFTFWYGTNDIIYFNREKYIIMKDMLETIADILFSKLDEIYNMGGRNFLFFKLMDQSLLPYHIHRLEENELIIIKDNYQVYNNRLIENAKSFHERHPDTNVFVYASDEELNYIIETYKNLNETRDNIIWNDEIHLTKETFQYVTQDMDKFLIGNLSDVSYFNISGNVSKITVHIVKILINILLIIYLFY